MLCWRRGLCLSLLVKWSHWCCPCPSMFPARPDGRRRVWVKKLRIGCYTWVMTQPELYVCCEVHNRRTEDELRDTNGTLWLVYCPGWRKWCTYRTPSDIWPLPPGEPPDLRTILRTGQPIAWSSVLIRPGEQSTWHEFGSKPGRKFYPRGILLESKPSADPIDWLHNASVINLDTVHNVSVDDSSDLSESDETVELDVADCF